MPEVDVNAVMAELQVEVQARLRKELLRHGAVRPDRGDVVLNLLETQALARTAG